MTDAVPRQIFAAYAPRARSRSEWRYCPLCGGRIASGSGMSAQVCLSDTCGRRYFRNPLPAVSVLVTRGDEFLLCRRSLASKVAGGRWCLPCGYIDHDEDFLAAGRREVREETGIEVEIEAIINVASNFLAPSLHSLVIVLQARFLGGTAKAGDDAVEAAWFTRSTAPTDWAFEADRYIVGRWFRGQLEGLGAEPASAHSPPRQAQQESARSSCGETALD